MAIVARPPRTTGESGCRRCQPSGVPAAHRPAACASPSSARLSRRRRSLLALQPRDARIRGRRRRVQAHGRQAEGALERAGGDVDELHPAVRHDRQAGEHHTAPDEQVFLPLRVAPRAEAPSDEPPQERSDDERSEQQSHTPHPIPTAPRQPRARRRPAAPAPRPPAGAASAAAARASATLPVQHPPRWTQPGSNRRPSRCQRDALPAELWAPGTIQCRHSRLDSMP